jgi:Xaa-Pro aminopeptidase
MKRINTLIQKLSQLNIDTFLITSVENVTYLSGFRGDSSHLVISANGCFLITDGRYTEQAQLECHKEIQIINWIDIRYGTATYQYIFESLKADVIGFETNYLSYADYDKLSKGLKNIQLKPVSSIVEEIRQIKDKDEVGFLEKACRISDKALEETVPLIKPGISEMEITAELEYQIKTNGAEDISFQTIVLSGNKTSLLHGRPNNQKVKAGDLLLFDFGALYNGYHADISRTFVIGKANTEQKKVYNIIHSAQHDAVQCLKDGIEGVLPDKIVRRNIPDEYLQYYYPGLGHGVGLQIHEQPFIKEKVDFIFKSGMVITIEPGVYIPGWGGIRIEDTIVITSSGFKSLTGFERSLIEL